MVEKEFENDEELDELDENEKVEEGDELVCYGKYRDFQSFWKAI